MTRDQAIELARRCAYGHRADHSYLPQTATEAKASWMPHEWVITALIDAPHESLMRRMQEQNEARDEPAGSLSGNLFETNHRRLMRAVTSMPVGFASQALALAAGLIEAIDPVMSYAYAEGRSDEAATK